MNENTELTMLRIWKQDALERFADDERAYQAQAEMLKEMHGVLINVADALHAAEMCLNGYVEIKDALLPKTKRKLKGVK